MVDPRQPMRSFSESPWRYSQFVVLGLLAAGLVKWLSPLGGPASLAAGALIAIGYWLFEKRRGVI